MPVANRLYGGRDDLLLLVIREEALGSEVRRENLVGGDELYPHVYGRIEVAVVDRVVPFRPGPDGRFELPTRLSGVGE